MSLIPYLAGVVDQAEVGISSEVWFLELGMCGMLGENLGNKSPVCSLGEPAFFIQQSIETHGL